MHAERLPAQRRGELARHVDDRGEVLLQLAEEVDRDIVGGHWVVQRCALVDQHDDVTGRARWVLRHELLGRLDVGFSSWPVPFRLDLAAQISSRLAFESYRQPGLLLGGRLVGIAGRRAGTTGEVVLPRPLVAVALGLDHAQRGGTEPAAHPE
jgi:hypothetical protein